MNLVSMFRYSVLLNLISNWLTRVHQHDYFSICFFYYFWTVFKDGGKEEKNKDPTSSCVKCYFVCMESNAFLDRTKSYPLSVHDARCVFMHVHTVNSLAGYMKRYVILTVSLLSAICIHVVWNHHPWLEMQIQPHFIKDYQARCRF